MKKKKKKNKRLKRLKNTTSSSSSQNQSKKEIPEEARELLDESIEEILFSPGSQVMGFGLYEGIEPKDIKKKKK